MKKLLLLLIITGSLSIISCGPNAEEKAKMEAEAKAKMDSLFNAASKSMNESIDTTAKTQESQPTK